MGPTPVLEMARAYGLRPRLWPDYGSWRVLIFEELEWLSVSVLLTIRLFAVDFCRAKIHMGAVLSRLSRIQIESE